MCVAYTAQGITNLAQNAPKIVPNTFLGTSLPVGDVLKILGVPIGIFVWSIGFWFFAVATASVISGVRQIEFTLNCWGFIFPNAGFTLAVIAIGNALDSNGIKAVASGMTILLVITWVLVAVCNVKAVIQGRVMWPGKDEDERDITARGSGDEEKQD